MSFGSGKIFYNDRLKIGKNFVYEKNKVRAASHSMSSRNGSKDKNKKASKKSAILSYRIPHNEKTNKSPFRSSDSPPGESVYTNILRDQVKYNRS